MRPHADAARERLRDGRVHHGGISRVKPAGHVGGGQIGQEGSIVHPFPDVGVQIHRHGQEILPDGEPAPGLEAARASARVTSLNRTAVPGRACATSGKSAAMTVAILAYPPVTGRSGPRMIGCPSPGTWMPPSAVPSGGMSGLRAVGDRRPFQPDPAPVARGRDAKGIAEERRDPLRLEILPLRTGKNADHDFFRVLRPSTGAAEAGFWSPDHREAAAPRERRCLRRRAAARNAARGSERGRRPRTGRRARPRARGPDAAGPRSGPAAGPRPRRVCR